MVKKTDMALNNGLRSSHLRIPKSIPARTAGWVIDLCIYADLLATPNPRNTKNQQPQTGRPIPAATWIKQEFYLQCSDNCIFTNSNPHIRGSLYEFRQKPLRIHASNHNNQSNLFLIHTSRH